MDMVWSPDELLEIEPSEDLESNETCIQMDNGQQQVPVDDGEHGDTQEQKNRREQIMVIFHALKIRDDRPYERIEVKDDIILLPDSGYNFQMFSEINKPPPGWEEAFTANRDVLIAANGRLVQKGAYLPPQHLIFSVFWAVPLNKIRVVIMGQDPYPQPGVANGLSFSTNRGERIPGSLMNVFKEIKQNYPDWDMPGHGDLTCWTKQGVFLLNSALTVGYPKEEHKDVWKTFVQNIIRIIADKRPNTIFVMWGKKAQELSEFMGSKTVKLTAMHPSNMNQKGGFFGCKHFLQINQKLVGGYRDVMVKAFEKGFYPEIARMLYSKRGVFINMEYWMKNCRFRQFFNVLYTSMAPEVVELRSMPGYMEILTNIYNGSLEEIDWTVY